MKNKVLVWALITVLLVSAVSVSAFNDNELKNYILNDIKKEEQLSKQELKEIEKDLWIITKNDIINSFKLDIENIKDSEQKKEILEKIKKLEKEEDLEDFISNLEEMEGKLISGSSISNVDKISDTNIVSTWIKTENVENDFEELKKDFINDLKNSLTYLKWEEKKIIEKQIKDLKKIKNEKDFFNKLENNWFISFPAIESKEETLKYFKEEIKFITDKELKKNLEKKFDELSKIKNDDDFYKKLDEIYNNKDLVKYYEKDFSAIADFSWEAIEYSIEESLKSVKKEINIIKDKKLKKKLEKKYDDLSKIKNEDDFYKNLDEIYNNEDLIKYYEKEHKIIYSWNIEKFESSLGELITDFWDVDNELGKQELINKLSNIQDREKFDIVVDEIRELPEFKEVIGNVKFVESWKIDKSDK